VISLAALDVVSELARRLGGSPSSFALRLGTPDGCLLVAHVEGAVFGSDEAIQEFDQRPGAMLRQSAKTRDLVREFDDQRKPIATLCHGPWLLASTGLADGRALTSWPGVRDDMVNAGAT
jgi:hypothetical protein